MIANTSSILIWNTTLDIVKGNKIVLDNAYKNSDDHFI